MPKCYHMPFYGIPRVYGSLAQVKRAHLNVSVIFWCEDMASAHCYTVARVFWMVARVWLGS